MTKQTTEFTPGPWFVKPFHGEANWSTIVLNDGKGGWVMVLQHNGEALEAQQQADARLVAAAPDLLEACNAALLIDESSSVSVDPQEIFDGVRAAVAKANCIATPARPTYAITWRRTCENEPEPYECTGLSDRDIVRRLIGAIANSGSVVIERITREPKQTGPSHSDSKFVNHD